MSKKEKIINILRLKKNMIMSLKSLVQINYSLFLQDYIN